MSEIIVYVVILVWYARYAFYVITAIAVLRRVARFVELFSHTWRNARFEKYRNKKLRKAHMEYLLKQLDM